VSYLLAYYLAGLAMLLLVLPLALEIFPGRPDRGWIGARPLGMVLAALLHRLAGLAQFDPWSGTTLLLLGFPAFGAWCIWALRWPGKCLARIASAWRPIVGIELVFLCSFAAAAVLTAHDPALAGTERLMDMAILQAVATAPAFPPQDPWLSGEVLNYYWLGHHLAGLPGALAGVPTAISYNLALAYIYATLIQLACGLLLPAAGGLRRALLGGVMVGLAGNLHSLLQLFAATPDPNLVLGASRIIPNTITEFPLLSLLVGDLHAHFTLLPLVLLFLLSLQVRVQRSMDQWCSIIVVNLLLLATAMGNPWNLPALLGLFATLKVLRCIALPWWTLAPALAMLPVAWPTHGLGIEPGWVPRDQTSSMLAFLEVWLIPLLLLAALVDWRTVGASLPRHAVLWLLPPLALALHSPAAGLCMALAGLLFFAHRPSEALWAGVAITALMLLIVPEVVYLRDGYPAPFERMNTVFKFHYAAWPLLMLVAARAALLLLDTAPKKFQPAWRTGLLFAFGLLSIYAAQALPQRLAGRMAAPLWDGIDALKEQHPQDIALIGWLAPHLQPGDICLEAAGISYQWSGRISALTGCSTVLGWEGHERLWRQGSGDISQRREDVQQLYLSADPAEQKRLLARYGIDWVIVGEVELARYGQQLPKTRDPAFEEVYSQGEAKIYRISQP